MNIVFVILALAAVGLIVIYAQKAGGFFAAKAGV